MKRNIILILLLQLTAIIQYPASAQPQQKFVTVYTFDFSGNKYEFGAGRYDNLYLAQSGMSTIQSVRVPAGMQAILYSEDHFRGESLVLNEDAHTPYLASRGFARIGLTISLLVQERPAEDPASRAPMVTLYMHDFAGESKALPPGNYEFADFGGIGNDQLSSVKIPKGMTVTLYEHSGFQGRKLVLTGDAGAGFLVRNNFNDVASSLVVTAAPEPAAVPVPAVVPAVIIAPVIIQPAAPVTAPAVVDAKPAKPMVTIYQGDFNGVSKTLEPGWYDIDNLAIGNDELSSIRIPFGFRVTLYEHGEFKGRSLVLNQDTHPQFLEDNDFNNRTSSLKVYAIPMATIYEGDYSGKSASLVPGRYGPEELGIFTDALSSVRVPQGLQVTLYEHRGFEGQSLLLKQDAAEAYLRSYFFDNITSSIEVEQVENAVPMVTLYQDDFSGPSNKLTAGNYDHQYLGINNNSLSSIRIPRGMKVTLYESGGFEGRTLELKSDTNTGSMSANNFDNITSSIKIEEIPASDLVVVVYKDSYSGPSISFTPGRYNIDALAFGDNQLSSARVPRGMRVILYEDANFSGRSVTLEADADLTGITSFNDHTSSLVVEDIGLPSAPVINPVAPADPVVAPAVVVPAVAVPAEVLNAPPPCTMTPQQYNNAINAVKSKSFRDEKMGTAQLATKGKCMTNDQIRGIAKLFSFEDQTLEFLKYAYDLSTEQSEYYTLDAILVFMGNKEEFTNFLKSK